MQLVGVKRSKRWGALSKLMMVAIDIEFEGENYYFDVATSSTVGELKEDIDQRFGHHPPSQKLYYLGLELEDDTDSKISEFLDSGFGNSFNLIVDHASSKKHQAPGRQFSAEKEMFLIVGGRTNFEAIHLKSGQKEIKKLKGKLFYPLEKFGLSENCEGEAGKRTFQVRIYEVQEEGNIIIRVDKDGKDLEVYLVNAHETIEMEPVDTKIYDECKKRDKIATILGFLKPFGHIINGIGGIVQGAATFNEAV